MKSSREPVNFSHRWHRVCLFIFCICWATMLIPPIIFPDSAVAVTSTLTLLGAGLLAIFPLLATAIYNALSKQAEHKLEVPSQK